MRMSRHSDWLAKFNFRVRAEHLAIVQVLSSGSGLGPATMHI